MASFATILDKDLRDRRKTAEADIQDLLSASYASMFGVEAGKRLRQVAAAFYREPPARLFGGGAAADWPGWAL